MIITIALILLLVVVTYLYMRQPKFGKAPKGERLESLKKSDNFREGKFQNISYTPNLTEGYSMRGILYEQLFKSHPHRKPDNPIPSVKTDLKNLPVNTNHLVWFGHSSYFMQIEGKRFLIDPVFSGNASPVPGSVKAFKGSDDYNVEDLPEIDYLLISHDHYDHLDYETILKLKGRVTRIICGLGVGAHFERWGFSSQQITETDWHSEISLAQGFSLYTTPARHFSGRGFIRNNTLWQSYVLQTPTLNLFLGGDSGYDTHFADIGEKYGPFDMAILENGQYNKAWEAIHMLPPQVLKAATELQAKRLFPVHSSKFSLSMHPWNEPLKELTRLNEAYNLPLVTPIIGQPVNLNNPDQQFEKWWEKIQ